MQDFLCFPHCSAMHYDQLMPFGRNPAVQVPVSGSASSKDWVAPACCRATWSSGSQEQHFRWKQLTPILLKIPFSQDFQTHFIKPKAQIEVTSPWRGPMHPAIWNTQQGCTAIRGEFSVLGTVLVSEPCCLAGYWLKHTSTLLSSCPKFLSLLLYINFPNTSILANLTRAAKWNTAEHVWKVLT